MRVPCSFCQGEFASNAALSSHVRNKHPFAKVSSFLKGISEGKRMTPHDDHVLILYEEGESSEEDLTEVKATAGTGWCFFLLLFPLLFCRTPIDPPLSCE